LELCNKPKGRLHAKEKKNLYDVEREKEEFVKEQLKKGYIKPLKSLQTLLVFFVGKRIEIKE